MFKVIGNYPSAMRRLFLRVFLPLGLLGLLAACGGSGGSGGSGSDEGDGGDGGNSTPTWQVTLENQDTTQLTLRVEPPTAEAVPATASGFDGTDTFTLAAGTTSVFSMPCGSSFHIDAIGGDTNLRGGANVPENCRDGGSTARVSFGAAGITWALEIRNPTAEELTLQVSGSTEAAFTGTPDSYNAETNRFTVAAGGSVTANLPCGRYFDIVTGGTAGNLNPVFGIRSRSFDCSRNAGRNGSSLDLIGSTWRITLGNVHTELLTLQVTPSTAAVLRNNRGFLLDEDTYRFGPARGRRLTASSFYVSCGVAFEIIAIGGDTSLTGSIAPPENCSAGGSRATVRFGAAGIVWDLELSNPAAVALTLQVSDATETALAGTPGRYSTDTNRFTVAADGSETVYLACGSNFEIVTGGTAANPAERIEPPPNCTEGGQSKSLAFTIATWQITLINLHIVPISLLVSEATEMAFTSTTPNYNADTNRFTVPAGTDAGASLPCGTALAISAIDRDTELAWNTPPPQDCFAGGSTARVYFDAAGITWAMELWNPTTEEVTLLVSDATEMAFTGTPGSYDADNNLFTLAPFDDATAHLRCGVAFAISAIGGDTNLETAIPSPPGCSDGGKTASVPFAATGIITWALELSNPAAVTLSLRVSSTTGMVLIGTTDSYSRRNFTLAAGDSTTARLPCGLNFAIVAGGTATNPTAAIEPPRNCAEGGQSKSLAFTSPTWELTLENQHTAQLTLRVEPPTAEAVPATASGFDGTNTFTLAAGAASVFNMPCGVAFAISAIGGNTSLTGGTPSPSGCTRRDKSARVRFGAAGITWAVNLRNRTGVELTLQVSDATEGAFPGTPGSYDAETNRFTLAAGGRATAYLPCSSNFETVAGGTATNPPASIPPPAGCTDDGTSRIVGLSDLPPLTAGTASPSFDLAGSGSQLLYYNVATADTRVFVTTSGAGTPERSGIELRVAAPAPNTSRLSDSNSGEGHNAALAFSAPVAGVYAITATNDGSAMASGLTVTVRTPAPRTSGVMAVAMSGAHSCFLLDTSLHCVGNNADGRLGASGIAVGDRIALLRPVSIPGAGSSAISAGIAHTCAISGGTTAAPNGSAYCWGNGSNGRLGYGTSGLATDSQSTPTQVIGLTSGVMAISAGEEHTCAIHSGAAKCWGDGEYGQLGNGDDLDRPSATGVSGLISGVTAISAGNSHTCAIHVASGIGAKCWGHGRFGQLGNGDTSRSNSPVQVSDLDSGVMAISAGSFHTCAIHVVSGNAAAKCWGWGNSGQLGNGGIGTSSSPVQVSDLDSGVSAISAGWEHTCAIHDEDTSSATNALKVKCWGEGSEGRLGNGITYDVRAPGRDEAPLPADQSSASGSNIPVTVSLPLGFVPATLSQGYSAYGSCAITSSGRPECWGRNGLGDFGGTGLLGDGGNADRNTPGAVYDSSGF